MTLTGSATCIGYAEMLAHIAAYRCAQDDSLKDCVEIEIISGPRLHRKSVDHAICKVVYTDQEGKKSQIILDPWGNINTPILHEHSGYGHYEETATIQSVSASDDKFQEKIHANMKEMSALIENVESSDKLASVMRKATRDLENSDSSRRYPLIDRGQRFYDQEAKTLKQDIHVRERRPSIESSVGSPLITSTIRKDETR